MDNLDRHGIAHMGTGHSLEEAWDFKIVDEFAIFAVSFTCFNQHTYLQCETVARMDNDIKYLKETIRQIRKLYPEKIITMFPHWGKEYDVYPMDFQREYARQAFDLGVDLIIGSHPHVVQEFEVIEGKPVFYSLGNAVFDQDWASLTLHGLGIVVFTGYDEENRKHYIENIVLHSNQLGTVENNFLN